MAGSEVSTVAQEVTIPINVAYQKRMLIRAKQLCPHYSGTTPATIVQMQSGSNVAKWRRINSLSPNTTARSEYAVNTDVAFPVRSTTRRPAITEITATLKKYGDFMYYTEELQFFNYDNTLAELADVFGELAGRTLNWLQRNVEEQNSTQYFSSAATNAATVNSAITRNDIAYVTSELRRNAAMKFFPETTGDSAFNTSPVNAGYMIIAHSDLAEDFRSMAGFVPVRQYAGQTMTMMGELGSLEDCRIILCEDSSITTNAGAAVGTSGLKASTNVNVDTYQTVVYGKSAFGSVGLGTEHVQEIYQVGDSLPGIMTIKNEIGSGGIVDPLREIGSIGFKTWHAATVLSPLDASNNTAWCKTIVSGATKLNV